MTRPGPYTRVLNRRKAETTANLKKYVRDQRKAARERRRMEREAAKVAAE